MAKNVNGAFEEFFKNYINITKTTNEVAKKQELFI